MRWQLGVTIVGLCLLAGCGSTVEQELVGSTQAGVMRSTLRLVLNPLRGRKASVQAMVRGVAKQRSYELLAWQLIDIRWEVVSIRTALERDFAADVAELKLDPLIAEELQLASSRSPWTEIAKEIVRLKQETAEQYEEWATQVAEDLRASLGASQFYRPETPAQELNLNKSAPPLHTMADLVRMGKTVMGIIESPLRL